MSYHEIRALVITMLILTAIALIVGLLTGCCAPAHGVTKSVTFTIEVRNADGSLQWRETQTKESGTVDAPGTNERIGK